MSNTAWAVSASGLLHLMVFGVVLGWQGTISSHSQVVPIQEPKTFVQVSLHSKTQETPTVPELKTKNIKNVSPIKSGEVIREQINIVETKEPQSSIENSDVDLGTLKKSIENQKEVFQESGIQKSEITNVYPPVDVSQEVYQLLQKQAVDCYPKAAERFSQHGMVHVSFCIQNQMPQKVEISKSSGSSILDEAVRECVVNQAAPFPVLSQGQCFQAPVRF